MSSWYRFSKPRGTWYRFRRAFARLDSTLTRSTPRAIRRALAAVEDFFVGKAYADTLPAGMALSFYHGDHLGSVNLITDHTGAQMDLAEYKPFGNFSRKETDPSLRGSGATEATSSIYYTGKRLDSTTGLYYYGARYYDPELGRFIQPDTIVQAPSDPQTLNRYTYVRNNPLIYTDPTGHSFWKSVAKWLGPIGRTVVSAVVAAVVFVGVTIASGGNVHLAAASAAGAFSFTNTFLNASAQGASFGRALAAGAVNGAAAFGAVYFGYGIGGIGGALVGASFGAAGGAASSAILGGNPGTGALSGAVGGAIMGGAGGAFGVPGILATSAGAGAASAAVSGGNVGQGAYLGAIGAISFAIASASFQAAIDAGRAKAGIEADAAVASKANQTVNGTASASTTSSTGAAAQPLTVSRTPFISPKPHPTLGQNLMQLGNNIGTYGDLGTVMGLVATAYGQPWGLALAAAGGITGAVGLTMTVTGAFLDAAERNYPEIIYSVGRRD